MEKYNICFSLDSNYVEQLLVSITSILKNADENDNIVLYILDGGLTQNDKQKIEERKEIKPFEINYIPINSADFKDCPMLCDMNKNYDHYHVTIPTYFRFKLAEVLPNLDKVLYLECDVIVKTSLKELFSIDISENSILMVKDAVSENEAKRLNLPSYYNAGVMLINLDFWRKNDVQNKLFEFAENNKDIILWQDQDVINCIV
jgi:lipopolysaccharide biosynthesis glycosyltransferase